MVTAGSTPEISKIIPSLFFKESFHFAIPRARGENLASTFDVSLGAEEPQHSAPATLILQLNYLQKTCALLTLHFCDININKTRIKLS